MDMGTRIKTARKNQGLSQVTLAEKVGVSPGGCGHWERDFNTPSVENLVKLSVVLNVRFEWLATGRGAMEYHEEGQDGFQQEREQFTPEDERQLLEGYRALSEQRRHLVTELVQFLLFPDDEKKP